ncbi:MAG: hypothetical protein J7K22_00125 [Nanoarchaeota archaeon]|nr:hypothetical protein [Nanoarchaeota archaeon]
MEGKIIYDWEEFKKELKNLENPKMYINTETTEKGNVLRIYAETEDVVLIFEANDLDIRKWEKQLSLLGFEYKYGESPVKIVKREEL